MADQPSTPAESAEQRDAQRIEALGQVQGVVDAYRDGKATAEQAMTRIAQTVLPGGER